MKPAKTWSVKGIDDMARNAAKRAAQERGMTLGQWLNETILQQAQASAHQGGAPAGGDDISRKLDDLAEQLHALVRREQATALAPAAPHGGEAEALAGVIARIERNEAAVAETLEMVNSRLDDLAERIGEAMAGKEDEGAPRAAEIEAALNNVVTHVETSEARTAETLENMNRRLEAVARQAAEAARLAAEKGREDHASALRELEARLEQMNHRLGEMQEQTEARTRAYVDAHMDKLVERVEAVHMASQALPAKVESLVGEVTGTRLAEAEERINLMVGQLRGKLEEMASGALDVERISSRVEEVGRKLEEVAARAASAQDLETMRTAIEQLSSAMENKAERSEVQALDERIAALAEELRAEREKSDATPQIAALEGKVLELERKLAEAASSGAAGEALSAMEGAIGGMEKRLERAERQVAQLPALEKAIAALSTRLENGAGGTSDEAEVQALREGLQAVREAAAASDAQTRETLTSVHETLSGIVSRLEALERAPASAAMEQAEQNAPASPQAAMAAAAMAGMAEPQAQGNAGGAEPQENAPAGAEAPAADLAAAVAQAARQAEEAAALAEPQAQDAPPLPEDDDADDFIAAARRAALAAAGEEGKEASTGLLARLRGRGGKEAGQAEATPGPEAGALAGKSKVAGFIRPGMGRRSKASEEPKAQKDGEKGRFSLSFLNRERKPAKDKPAKGPETAEAKGDDQAKRRRLMLMGVLLMAAVSAFIVKNRQVPAPQPAPAAVSAPAPAAEQAKPAGQDATGQAPAAIMPQKAAEPARPEQHSQLSPADEAAHLAQGPAAQATAQSDPITTASLGKAREAAPLAAASAGPRKMPSIDPRIGTPALRMAAEAGDARAQFVIASHYLQGRGVPRDYAKAAQWYARAAAQGLAVAQYRLGTLYERGRGLPRSTALARTWYEKAARAGNVKAMHNLAVILADNSHGKADMPAAARWFTQAAERGLRDSQYNLAVLHQRGLGVKQDLARAYKWYGIAARLGDADAAQRKEALKPYLKAGEAARVEREVAAWTPKKPLRSANFVLIDKPEWRKAKVAAKPTAETATAAATEETKLPTGAERIRRIQKLLSRLGYDAGPVDGKMGNRTANAIRLFQLQNGLPVNGQPTAQVLQRLESRTSHSA